MSTNQHKYFFSETKEDILSWLQKHLDEVSRSFALTISRLKYPLRLEFSVAYLLLRVIDTIEDHSLPKDEKKKLFSNLITQDGLINRSLFIEKADWIMTLPAGERALLNDFPRLADLFGMLSEGVRQDILALLKVMISGMVYFLDLGQRLKDLTMVNSYCFFVAGIVGDFLHRRCIALRGDWGVDLLSPFRFGFFLQKVNILKDQHKDQAAGRDWVHNQNQLLESALTDARVAFRYALRVPIDLREYRFFCFASVFLGVETLWQIFLQKPSVRRKETLKNLQLLEGILENEDLLFQKFNRYIEKLECFLGSKKDCASEDGRPFRFCSPSYYELYSTHVDSPLSIQDFERLLTGGAGR